MKVSCTRKDCLGGGRTLSVVVKPLVQHVVVADNKVSAPGIQKLLKNKGCDVSTYTALRMKQECLGSDAS